MTEDSRPDWGELVAVAAVSMMVLALEVALTRAFSVLLRFHYVFLAVSLAVCGLGFGGLIDHFLGRRSARPVMGLAAAGAALLAPAGVIALFATPLSAHLTSLWVISFCCVPGFTAAGVFLSRAFSVWGKHSGVLYFADLTGAALSAAGVIVLLQFGGAVNAAFWCSALAAFGAALAWRRLPFTVASVALGCVLVFVGLANLHTRTLDLPALRLAGDPLAKPLYQELGDPNSGARLIHSYWNAFARTDVVAYARPDGTLDPDGDYYLYTDGEVPTNILRWRGDLREFAARYRDFIGLYPFRMLRPEKAMLIGPGGGLDVWLALIVGARKIDGAEINPSIPDIVRAYRPFGGPVYDFSGVNIRVAEGRSFLRGVPDRYDIIYMALTKTATTATASMALVESYVHTIEAFRDYHRHLSDRGAVAFVCQNTWVLMRQMLTALAALEAEGLSRQDALGCIGMMSVPPELYRAGPYRHLVMMFRKPQSAARWQEMAKQAVASNLVPIYFPGVYEPRPFDLLRDPKVTPAVFVRQADALWFSPGERGLDFGPCPDDRPFVVDLTFGVPAPLRGFLTGTGIVLVVFFALALGLVEPIRTPFRNRLWLLYFAGLGVAFMLVEIVLIQTFTLYLGYPVLSLATVLFGILLGAGLGSLLSQGCPVGRCGLMVPLAIGALIVLTLVVLTVSPAVFNASLAWDVRLRSLITLAFVVPVGMLLGVPFPSGVRLAVDAMGAAVVPWLWAINGVASVLGSCAAMAVAKIAGFHTTIILGLGIYLLAAGILTLQSRK
jgi:hypothetical protein